MFKTILATTFAIAIALPAAHVFASPPKDCVLSQINDGLRHTQVMPRSLRATDPTYTLPNSRWTPALASM